MLKLQQHHQMQGQHTALFVSPHRKQQPSIKLQPTSPKPHPPLDRNTPHREAMLAPETAPPSAPQTPAAEGVAEPAPTMRQLAWVAFSKGIPFIAFGFMDNIIMVGAGLGWGGLEAGVGAGNLQHGLVLSRTTQFWQLPCKKNPPSTSPCPQTSLPDHGRRADRPGFWRQAGPVQHGGSGAGQHGGRRRRDQYQPQH